MVLVLDENKNMASKFRKISEYPISVCCGNSSKTAKGQEQHKQILEKIIL